MRCLVDMDGVIVELVGAWLRYRGLRMPEPWPQGKYYLSQVFDLDPELAWRGCDEDWWASLPKTEEADAILNIVEQRFAPEEIYIVTEPFVTAGATGKLLWLDRHYPRFLKQFFITPCREILANAETILIDDSAANTDLFNRCGGQAILWPRPWNRRFAKSNQAVGELERCLASTFGNRA